ncbi:MAG: DsbA family protein [Patescibacteria group bacterium]
MTENKINTPGAIIIAGIIIAVAIFLTSGKFTTKKDDSAGSRAPSPQEIAVSPVSDKDHLLGNPQAKIVVIEFSDTECPFCKKFHPTMQKIVADYKGQVAWVYRHFPIDSLHSRARKEAEATECANEFGGNTVFWQYLDKIFELTPSNDGLDPAELPKIAETVGLDVTKFNVCLSSGKYKDLVESNYEDGIKAGVTGTPASVVMNIKTGKKTLLVGAESYDNVKRAIESIK